MLLQATFHIYLSNFTTSCDESYMKINSEVKLSHSHDDYHINLTFFPLKPLKTLFVNGELYLNPVGFPNQSTLLYKNTVNICKLLQKNNAGNMVASFYKALLRKYGQIPRSCPIPAVSIM